MLILHGSPFSGCTSRVLAVFAQLGLVQDKDYQLVDVEFWDIKKPEWLKHQPFGQMPYLEDTEAGLEFYESRAISRYVAAKYNSPLAPKYEDSPRAYAAFERAAIGESAQIDNLAVPILMELLFGPKLYNKEPDMNRVALSPAALSSKFKVYDTILANSTFLAGEEMTLADLWHGPSLTLLEVIGKGAELSDGSLPNLARWWAAVTASKGWQHVLSLGFAAHYQ